MESTLEYKVITFGVPLAVFLENAVALAAYPYTRRAKSTAGAFVSWTADSEPTAFT